MDNPGEITEILRLCRLCLVKDQVNIPIFDEQGDIRQIFLKISSCLPVKVSREDQLPKKICDGCSNKLDLLYEFWNTSANAEKTLLSWLGQAGVKDADETISAVAQQIAKPVEIPEVKEETEPLEDGQVPSHATDSFPVPSSFDEGNTDEAEAPPPKRARRTAAVKAQINLAPESDDDEDDDMDNAEPMTKMEDESDESEGEEKDPSYSEVPGTSADDQAGPSGVGKDGVEAPVQIQENSVYWSTHQCTYCKLTFYTEEALQLHGANCFINCDICQTLVQYGEYMDHLNIHNYEVKDEKFEIGVKTKRPRNIKCPLCDKLFSWKDSLRLHMKLKHTDEASKVEYLCEICGLKFMEKRRILTHIKRDHLKLFNFKCSICGKGFLNKSRLTAHEAIHTVRKSDEDLVPCTYPDCTKVFKNSQSLYYHLHNHDEKKVELNCDHCNKIFTNRLLYNKHMRKHTAIPKRHECEVCGKTVTTLTSLRDHMLLHTGEKPCVCEYCGRGFRSNKTLSTHLVVHTKVRKHVCKFCGKDFTQRGPLRAHLNKMHPDKDEHESA